LAAVARSAVRAEAAGAYDGAVRYRREIEVAAAPDRVLAEADLRLNGVCDVEEPFLSSTFRRLAARLG
jgi:hypothetical protein